MGRALGALPERVNAANAVTLARIVLVPVVIVFLVLADGPSVAAAVLFAVVAATDSLDGYLARSRREVTTFGKLIDPLADKLLIVGVLVTLVAVDRLAAWVVVVVAAREIAVSGLRAVAKRRDVVISASALGKAKTCSQVAAIVAVTVASDPGAAWVLALVYAAVAVTVASGVDYFARFARGSDRGSVRSGQTARAAARRVD